LREPNLSKTNPCVSLLYSLAICFYALSRTRIIFLTLTRLVVVINFVNFSFALFTPPLGDFHPLMYCALPPFEPPDGVHQRRLALAVVGGVRPHGDRHLSAIARLQGFSSCSPTAFPHQRSVWWGEASWAAASALPSASRIFVILAEAEERTEWGVASAWAGDPFLPPAFGGERHPPALWRRPPSMRGKANCCSPDRVQLSVLRPGGGRAAPGPATSRSSSHRQPRRGVAQHVVRREGGARVLGWPRQGRE
jgi:hypothetical protein